MSKVSGAAVPTLKQIARKNTWNKIKKYRILYLFLLPGIVLIFLFSYLPMFGLTMVFQDYNPLVGFAKSPWVGLDNFRKLFSMPSFFSATRNTIVISLLKILFGFPAPIIFALLLNEVRRLRLKKAIQTVTYLPHFISWVIVAGIWYKLLSPDGGLVNHLLLSLNVVQKPIYFMQNGTWFYVVLIFTDLWKGMGYGSIYYMASIASTDVEQYEAASIDGAGRFKQAIHITLPTMKPTIVLLAIYSVAGLLDAGFNQLWTMGNLAVRDVGEIIDTAVIRTLTTGNIRSLSIGAAMGFFKSVIGVILFLGTNWLARLIKQESVI